MRDCFTHTHNTRLWRDRLIIGLIDMATVISNKAQLINYIRYKFNDGIHKDTQDFPNSK